MRSPTEPRFLAFIHRFLDRGPVIHILILMAFGFFAYGNAILHPFVHDDVVFILQNPNIGRWDNITDAFLRPAIPQIFQGLVTPYYRPVLEVIYRIEYAIFGFNAHGFHFFNLIIHAANGLILYALARRLFDKEIIALMIAAVFLVHPVQTEAVACVAGISNLACTFFMLISLYGYVRSVQAIGSPRIFWMVVAVGVFIVALLTKEQAVVLPAVCLMYEVLNKERQNVSSFLSRVGLMVLPLLGYLFLRQTLFGSFVSSVFENIAELKLRVLAMAGLFEMYGGLLFFPSGLHYYRSVDILAPYVSSWIILGMIVLLVYLCLRPLTGLNKKISFFGLAWFLLALGPVLNIIPLVNEYAFIAAAEHNLYFPMIGVLISAGAVANHYAPTFNHFLKVWARTLFIIGIMCLSVLTIAQNRYWQGEIPLFQRALTFEPQLGRVHILLAKAYFNEGRMDQAIQEFSFARDIMNGYVQKAATPKAKRFYKGLLKGIYSDSAQAYASKGDLKTSVEHYNLALEIDPQDSYIYTNRALSLIAVGDFKGGVADLQKALVLNPNNLLAANNLSICFIQQGDVSRARGLLESILLKDPGFTAARDNLDKLNKAQKTNP